MSSSHQLRQAPPPPPDQILDNVLESVLHFLTTASDRNAASLVSRSWHSTEARTRPHLSIPNCYAVSPLLAVRRFHAVRSLLLKGRPRFADFSLVPVGWGANARPWVEAFAPAYPWLERISFKRMTVTDADLVGISVGFKGFRELVLNSCDGFGSAGIAAVAQNCRQLRVLDLVDTGLEDDDVEWISKFPENKTCLESLVFDCVDFEVDFAALEALVGRSPCLKRLQVNHFVSIGQLSRLMSLAPQLSHLDTGSFHPAPGGVLAKDQLESVVSAFSASKSLTCLSGFRNIVPEHLPTIYPVCANLTYLNFSYTDITGEHLGPVISRCHNLQKLWVLDTVRDEGLEAVAATCKDLQELRVFPMDPNEDTESPVSDVGLIAISEGCRKLRSILYFCQRMTNNGVITMSENCPDLVVFRLCIMGRRRPDHLTGQAMDEGFGAIVRNCKKLTRLAVSGLLTDKAFEYIGKFGKLVRTLSVAFAGDSDLSMRCVLEGCPKLKKLEIRDSPFGDSGLLSGLHHYYNMRFLWMSSCKLSLSACKEVAQRLPHVVVEVIRETDNFRPCNEGEEDENCEAVERLYMYRSLAGPRTDAPPFVQIL